MQVFTHKNNNIFILSNILEEKSSAARGMPGELALNCNDISGNYVVQPFRDKRWLM